MILNKEFCNYKDESFKWGYMADEHRNSGTFLTHGHMKIGWYKRSSKRKKKQKKESVSEIGILYTGNF